MKKQNMTHLNLEDRNRYGFFISLFFKKKKKKFELMKIGQIKPNETASWTGLI